MKKFDATIAGYICIDMFPEIRENSASFSVSEFFRPGKLIEIDGIEFYLGGAVANTGLAMKRFGKKVFLNGLVGNDPIGQIALKMVEKYGLKEGIQTTDRGNTASSIVLAPPGIDRIFLESLGCSNLFNIDHIPLGRISESHVFHFGYPPLLEQFYMNNGAMLVDLLSTIKGLDVITSLDMSLMDPGSKSYQADWKKIMENVLPFIDIFVPSIEEIFQIMRPDEYIRLQSHNKEMIDLISREKIRELGRALLDMGAKIIFIKAGHHGSYLVCWNTSSLNSDSEVPCNQWDNCELWCDAFPADHSRILNASGSGDVAVAAFLSAFLDGEGPATAMIYANIAGRDNLYCHNTFENLPGWGEIEHEIKAGREYVQYL